MMMLPFIQQKCGILVSLCIVIILAGCDPSGPNGNGTEDPQTILPPYTLDEFVMGADLSYLNQILDKGGEYTEAKNPYDLFSEMGVNLVRLRLWHSPEWVRTVYANDDEILYSGLDDVIQAARDVAARDMSWCLDFHYSDNWADPEKQTIPAAWEGLSLDGLTDSVYQYTRNVLTELKNQELAPAFVQIGNEINNGMLHPIGHIQANSWKDLGQLLNAGISAVRDVFAGGEVPGIIIHIAQPENIRWFFNNLTIAGGVDDFDIIGVSYYAKWSQVDIRSLDGYLRAARSDFGKKLMIMETAFPWTNESADNYTNIWGGQDSIMGFAVNPEGQLNFMKSLCQEVIDGGGMGVVYWEPGWITSEMTTQWGRGSAWENCTFFDFLNDQAVLPVIDYINFTYTFK